MLLGSWEISCSAQISTDINDSNYSLAQFIALATVRTLAEVNRVEAVVLCTAVVWGDK